MDVVVYAIRTGKTALKNKHQIINGLIKGSYLIVIV